MTTLSTELNVAEADVKVSRLEAAGFHPSLANTDAAAWMGCASTLGGLLVQVPDEEAADAKEFLDGTVTLDKPLE